MRTRILRIVSVLGLIVITSYLHGCGGLECGPGTREDGGQCRPLITPKPTTCAEGTKKVNNQCVPEADAITCGAHTRLSNGECVGQPPCAEDDPSCTGNEELSQLCAQGRILRGGECVFAQSQVVRLPFEVDQDVYISQGYHGNFSHFDLSRYALDFPIPEGTPIMAARAGVVAQTKSDSSTGCDEVSCANQANYITIDHGDGTFARYYHLQLNGVDVEVGEAVCAGQKIGSSGNTGFSTAPHLHFEILDSLSQTQPIFFEELLSTSGGVPYIDQNFRSTNQEESGCAPVEPSMCWGDMFLHRGVMLDETIPCGAVIKDKSYTLSGQSLSYKNGVLIGTYSNKDKKWYNQCVLTTTNGQFEADVIWPQADHTNVSYMIVTPAVYNNGSCESYPGWKLSMKILLRSN